MSNTNPAQQPAPQSEPVVAAAPVQQPILDPAHPQFWEYHGQQANRG